MFGFGLSTLFFWLGKTNHAKNSRKHIEKPNQKFFEIFLKKAKS